MTLAGLVLGSLILYLKGMRIMMFQLSGFCYTLFGTSYSDMPWNGERWALWMPEGQAGSSGVHMGGCQNYGPFLGPYYNTAHII